MDIEPDGQAVVLVPTAQGTTVYRVDLGQRYQSLISGRQVQAASATMKGKSGALASPMQGTSSLTRKQTQERAVSMLNKTWPWHGSYNYFNNTTPRGNWTSPSQFIGAAENATMSGIPYAMGGFDTDWSHTDWSAWSTWDNARTIYYNLGQQGPLVGNTTGSWAGAGSAGLDCSGFVYAAAGLEGSMVNAKKGTVHLISDQSNWYAGLDAGASGNAQPFNYFVRHVEGGTQHTFYYEERRLDMSGYDTIEATVDGSPDAVHRYTRTWGDISGYTHRSWWAYTPGGGESIGYAKTSQGAQSACYGIRGQNVWYTYTKAGAHTVTLTNISGGDPDMYVLDASLALVGKSDYSNQTNESVYVPSGGTYYVFVHIWRSYGACTNYTISW